MLQEKRRTPRIAFVAPYYWPAIGGVETAMRELGTPSLLDALDYLDLLAEVRPEKLEYAALRWHGRLELEASMMTLAESQLALAALASLCAGEREVIDLLRKLLRRVRPTLLCRVR